MAQSPEQALDKVRARVEALAKRYPVDRPGRGDTSEEDLTDALEHTHAHARRPADDLPPMFQRHER